MDHPRATDLTRWLGAPGGRVEDRRLLAHLLRCPRCRRRALSRLEAGAAAAAGPLRPAPPAAVPPVGELVAALLDEPAARREVRVRASRRLHRLDLAEALTAASGAVAAEDAGEAAARARLALLVLERLDEAFHGRGPLAAAAARAAVALGDALRRAGELDEAEGAFERAARDLATSGDPSAEPRLEHRLATLRRAQGRLDEAARLLDRAAHRPPAGDADHGAEVLLDRGRLELERGRPGEALEPLLAALGRVDPLGDPELAAAIRRTLAWALVRSGRPAEAGEVLARARPGAAAEEEPWLAGVLAAADGDLGRAEELLATAGEACRRQGRAWDAARVGLDLAAVYARQGRGAELEALARRLAPLRFSPHLDRRALAALTAFLHAAERGRAEPALVARAARHLERVGQPRERRAGSAG